MASFDEEIAFGIWLKNNKESLAIDYWEENLPFSEDWAWEKWKGLVK